MNKSVQKKLGKIRPPRVQISYDVEIGDALERKELPFVVGVLADLCGQGGAEGGRLADSHFIEIDAGNVDKVMAAMAPAISVRVPDRLLGEGDLNVEIQFNSMDAFSPAAVARAVPSVAKLLEVRERLNDLLAKLEGNDRLNDLLAEVVSNTEIQQKARSEVGQLQGNEKAQ